MTLNPDQEAAALAVFQFLLSDDREFSISGPAGTGKTFLMHHIRNTVLSEYTDASKLLGMEPVPYDIELCATTNKATEVLTRSTGFPASTIHSFLGLKVWDDYSTGQTKIKKSDKFQVRNNLLIFIDEASMIDAQLHKFILESLGKNSKVIYLGDHCQMAPVNESLSPVYARPTGVAKLTQPMRNAGQPALVALCAQLRHTVETGEFRPIREVPGVIDYVNGPGAQAFIDSTFAKEGADSRVLGFTNHRVQEYNEYVRDMRGYPDHFVKGERVINNAGITIGTGRNREFLRVEQEVTIDDAAKHPTTVEVAEDHDEKVTFQIYELKLEIVPGFVIPARIPADRAHFKSLQKYYADKKKWSAYFWLKNNFPDLRQRDAATVYKAQGSTYESTFLDLANIGKSHDADQVARMLYVGASRATTRLVLFGQLPPRYQNSKSHSAEELV